MNWNSIQPPPLLSAPTPALVTSVGSHNIQNTKPPDSVSSMDYDTFQELKLKDKSKMMTTYGHKNSSKIAKNENEGLPPNLDKLYNKLHSN